MPNPRRFELDELLNRPGTYYNPETEIVLIVDDSAHLDSESLAAEESEEEAEWLLIADEVPVDEHRRDELMERFQIRHESRAAGVGSLDDEDDFEEDEEELSELGELDEE